ncbi:hypothetical protein AN189_09000 [Loktanella sp. 3ANDIMAR09]|nr:hypothetical protein AN189_09000 [Loktanella sp. 3ANDIMAR09]
MHHCPPPLSQRAAVFFGKAVGSVCCRLVTATDHMGAGSGPAEKVQIPLQRQLSGRSPHGETTVIAMRKGPGDQRLKVRLSC